MALLMITVAVIIICIAFLWKTNYASWSASNLEFLKKGEDIQKKNVLLVIAHPDDESMFFSPTITYLTSTGHNLYLLCISTGNADGKGRLRKEELYQACAILQIPLQQVKILDHPNLQDGFGKAWDIDLIAKIIEDDTMSWSIDSIITFDNYGVSGHCNHRDVHLGVRKLLQDTSRRNLEAWELVSTNLLRKYIGPIDIWFSMSSATRYASGDVYCVLNKRPRTSFHAMAQHRSQWVWFRKLFVSFSSYTYVNTLKRIE